MFSGILQDILADYHYLFICIVFMFFMFHLLTNKNFNKLKEFVLIFGILHVDSFWLLGYVGISK